MGVHYVVPYPKPITCFTCLLISYHIFTSRKLRETSVPMTWNTFGSSLFLRPRQSNSSSIAAPAMPWANATAPVQMSATIPETSLMKELNKDLPPGWVVVGDQLGVGWHGLAFSSQHVANKCSKCVWPKPRTHPKDQSHSENFLEARWRTFCRKHLKRFCIWIAQSNLGKQMETTVFRGCSPPKTSHICDICHMLHITETSWNFSPSDLKHLWFFLVSEASAVEQLQHFCSGPCADVSSHPGDFFDERAQQGLATWLSCSGRPVGGGLAWVGFFKPTRCK